jgi:hypothetical protein
MEESFTQMENFMREFGERTSLMVRELKFG